MSRKPVIAGNWKMNNNYAEAVVLTQEISNLFERDLSDNVDVIICPPAVDLKGVKGVLEFDKRKIYVGAQNCYFEKSGAFTGEVSISMISDAGADFCIVGHSERRDIFGETNDLINDKVRALVSYEAKRMTPILCVGESLNVREQGDYIDFVNKQINAGLAGVDIFNSNQLIVAYEPIWAIGTGRTATPEQAQEVCAAIRSTLKDLYGERLANEIRVLYGGSMNEGNVEMLLAKEDIDGGLIGGASLKANSFVELVKAAKKCKA